MTGKIFHLPVPDRRRTLREDRTLDAATEFILTELNEPASIDSMRAFAKKELARPRDSIHRTWCEVFLKETEEYK